MQKRLLKHATVEMACQNTLGHESRKTSLCIIEKQRSCENLRETLLEAQHKWISGPKDARLLWLENDMWWPWYIGFFFDLGADEVLGTVLSEASRFYGAGEADGNPVLSKNDCD